MATDHGEGATAAEWNALSRDEVLRRIEALAADFLECLSDGKVLELEALKRNSSALVYDHQKQRHVHGNDKRLVKLNRQGGRRYTGIWLILQTAHALLTESKTATQRDVYYLHPFFKGQSEADEAILDAGSILGVPRGCMNIVGATKGCFTGDISILVRYGVRARRQNTGDLTNYTEARWQLETFWEWRREVCASLSIEHHGDVVLGFVLFSSQSNAKCILVIEKDGIFNRLRYCPERWLDLVYPLTNSPSLREDKFYEMVPSILITGRGFPDLATRVFVSLLSHALKIPVLGLCDCNPFGLSIMLTYKLGSARMPLESLEYAVNIKWIGVRPSQVATLGLPQSSFKALTRKDIAVANSLLQASFVQANEHYRREVRMWLEDSLPWKIELEALHFLGFTFLTSFLQDCIEGDNFL